MPDSNWFGRRHPRCSKNYTPSATRTSAPQPSPVTALASDNLLPSPHRGTPEGDVPPPIPRRAYAAATFGNATTFVGLAILEQPLLQVRQNRHEPPAGRLRLRRPNLDASIIEPDVLPLQALNLRVPDTCKRAQGQKWNH